MYLKTLALKYLAELKPDLEQKKAVHERRLYDSPVLPVPPVFPV